VWKNKLLEQSLRLFSYVFHQVVLDITRREMDWQTKDITRCDVSKFLLPLWLI